MLEVGLDFGGSGIKSYVCTCGYETASVDELVAHVKAHGATAVRVEVAFFDDVRRG